MAAVGRAIMTTVGAGRVHRPRRPSFCSGASRGGGGQRPMLGLPWGARGAESTREGGQALASGEANEH